MVFSGYDQIKRKQASRPKVPSSCTGFHPIYKFVTYFLWIFRPYDSNSTDFKLAFLCCHLWSP